MQLAAAARAASDGPRRGISRLRSRPKVLCGIPDRDYIQGGPNGPATALSQIAQLIPVRDATVDGVLPSGRRAYHYQLNQGELRVDHCSISRVALAIVDDGRWTLSFRADQNRRYPDDQPLIAVGRPTTSDDVSRAPNRQILPGATATVRFSEHIRRNLFTIRVRGYGAYAAEADPDLSPGRPVLFELSTPPFWVQKQVPLFPRFEGIDPQVAEFARSVDRVEIELSYR
jgi:hypothetical protein